MKRHSEKDILKVKKLRFEKKYSYAHISRLTGIPETTLGHWFRQDERLPRNESILQKYSKKRADIKKSETTIIKHLSEIHVDTAKILTAIIYWCEGSKYPASNALTFVNSDPELVKVFVLLLRRAFTLDESKFTVHLQIHTSHDFEKTKLFWSNLLNIDSRAFIKPTVTIPRGKKHREVYYGTCTIKYYDFRLLLKLMGIYEAFAQKLIKN